MKKFIVVLLLAFAPSLAFADTGGCFGGGLFFGGLGSLIGGGVVPKILATTGAIGGCNAVSRWEDGTYGKGRNIRPAVYSSARGMPSMYGPGDVVCDRTPNEYGWRPGPGMCKDPDLFGAQTTPADLVRRAEARQRKAEEAFRAAQGAYAQPVVQPVAYSQPVAAVPSPVSPVNKWERPENRQKEATQDEEGPLFTVKNYREGGALPSDCNCQTGNWAADAAQLRKRAKELADLQPHCTAGEKHPDCPSNPGVLSSRYYDLADALDLQQKEGEKRHFVK